MPSLFQLPNEVLGLVVDELEPQGLFNLRLASRHAHSITLPTFIKRHFETRYVMLTRAGLENLAEISRHNAFSTALKTIEICLDHLTEEPNTRCNTSSLSELLAQRGYLGPQASGAPGRDVEGGRARDGQRNSEDGIGTSEESCLDTEPVLNRQAYDDLLEEQRFMMQSGLITAHLTQVFSAASSMESLIINNTSRPWGAMAQKRLTGLLPTNTIDDYDSIEYVKGALLAIFSAIVASKTSLHQLDISAGWDDEAISPDMLVFPRPYQSYFRDVPASLTSLALTLSPTPRMGGDNSWTNDFLGFMTVFPHIQRLDLGFGPRDENERFSSIAQTLRLQKLQYVNIDCVDCAAEDLTTFLLNHKDTLNEVHLSCMEIPGGEEVWHTLLYTIREKTSIEAVTVDQCESEGLHVLYRSGNGDCMTQLQQFKIRTGGDRCDMIEKVTVGRLTVNRGV